ncbi:hypothetical protein ACLBXM_15300 [Xanthobacteraceae bacterium A53D]
MMPITVSTLLDWMVGKAIDETATHLIKSPIHTFLRRRAEKARDIALEEIRAGRGFIPLDLPTQDEASAILWRYLRAAEEGAAHLNLRIMASIMSGRPDAPPIYASEFLRWSDLITSLSRQEIVLLATLHRVGADKSTRQEFIPKYFENEKDFELSAEALVRTGLIEKDAIVGWSDRLGGRFKTSHRMEELVRLADLEGALDRDTHANGNSPKAD